MSKNSFLAVFHSLENPNFDTQAFRLIFVKAAWKAYTGIVKQSISQSDFQNLLNPLFISLFVEKDAEIENNIHAIRDLFRDPEEIELFFSDTFYIVLNHYIKSFYGTIGGWDKIIALTSAIENFIAHVAKRFGDESFFIFEDALINALELLRQRSETITVLNTYYGVPIQYPAQILHTDKQSVIIRVHPLQETAAILQNGIYLLKNDHIIHDVYASVIPMILNGERVLKLSRFDQLETSLFHRQSIRVQPQEPYLFTIVHSSITLRAQVYDISIGGIAVTSQHPYSLSLLNEVRLVFPSEIMPQSCDMEGRLVYKSGYEGGYKYHFKIFPTLQQEVDLSKYIARREQEIIKKLRDEIV
ncbi:PilZ domain-containing protein [Sulfuricurvum sp.]|uniref:PilZ domain-containing protein n=1 Tax=Sulfuricurvum sp. TaxID=2025608 RepID=UPI003BAF9FD2